MALSAHSDMKLGGDEPPSEGEVIAPKKHGSSALKVLGGLVGLTLLAGGIWIGFGDKIMPMFGASEGDVPVITADPAPIKIRPENPGGMQVPNQGRLVYGVVDGFSSQPRVERLLPSPEKPMEVDQVLKRGVPETAEVVTNTAPRGTADASAPRMLTPEAMPVAKPLAAVPSAQDVAKLQPPPVAPGSSPSLTVATPSATATPAPPPIPAATTKAAAPVASSPVKTAAAPAAPAVKAPVNATPALESPASDLANTYRVQLAAARSEDAVKSEWDNLRRRHIDLLGELRLQVMKIDLGATKGIFYRLRAGPLADEPTAKALCERLKQRKIGCLVVKPGS